MTSVTEAARELLGLVGAESHCHADPANGWHTLTGARHPAANCPACALRSAIAAEEARQAAVALRYVKTVSSLKEAARLLECASVMGTTLPVRWKAINGALDEVHTLIDIWTGA